MDLSSSSDHDTQATDDDVNQSIDLINLKFNQQLDLQAPVIDEDHKNSSNKEDNHDEDEHHDDDDNDDDDDDDFTFMLIGNGDGTNYDDEVFDDGKIRPVFPLFDQKLLLTGEYEIEELDRLPILPPVDKIFVESPRGFTSSEVHKENEDEVAGPYCDWSKDSATATEMSKKSNSTGFSKLWRLKEKVGRSNSDGRDAFVFLKNAEKLSRTTTATTAATTTTTTGTGEGTYLKVKVGEGTARVVKKETKGKKKAVSAHEVYLRSRGGMAEEERRRSYLPYRPELMGLFTNVNGGLSKNVHPY